MKIVISQAIWGKNYVDIFLRYSYSSLMASGNLIECSKKHQITLDIHTTKIDYPDLKKGLKKFEDEIGHVKYRYIEDLGYLKKNIPGEIGDSKYSFLTELQNDALVNSKEFDYIVFNYSDFIWTNNSLNNLFDELSSESDAILGFCPPVDKYRFTEEVEQRKEEYYSGEALTLESKKSVELAITYLHREAKLRYWDSPNFTLFPTYLIWNIPEEGILLRAYHQTILALKTNLKYLEGGISGKGSLDGYVSSLVAQYGKYSIANDSRKIFVYSLYETGLDSLAPPWINREESLVRCLSQYITEPQRNLALVPILIKYGDINIEKWDTFIDLSFKQIKILHETVEFNSTLYARKNKPVVLSIIKNSKIKNIINYILYKVDTYTKLLTNSKVLEILFNKFKNNPHVIKRIKKIQLLLKNIDAYRARRYIEKRLRIYEIRMRILNKVTEYYKKILGNDERVIYKNQIEYYKDINIQEYSNGAWRSLGYVNWYGHIDSCKGVLDSNNIYFVNNNEIEINITENDSTIHIGYRLTKDQCDKIKNADVYEISGEIYLLNQQSVEIFAHILVPFVEENYVGYDDFNENFKVGSLKEGVNKSIDHSLMMSQNSIWTKYSFIARNLRNKINFNNGLQFCLSINISEPRGNKIHLKNIELNLAKRSCGIYGVDERALITNNIIERGRLNKYVASGYSKESLLRKLLSYTNYIINIKLITNYNEDKDNNLFKYLMSELLLILYEIKNYEFSAIDRNILLTYSKKLTEWMLRIDDEYFHAYEILVNINLLENDHLQASINAIKFKQTKERYITEHFNRDLIKFCTFHVSKGLEDEFLKYITTLIKFKILEGDARKYLVVFDENCYQYKIIKNLFSQYINLYFREEIPLNDWIIIRCSKVLWQIDLLPNCNNRFTEQSSKEIKDRWDRDKKFQPIINYTKYNKLNLNSNKLSVVIAIDERPKENIYFINSFVNLISKDIQIVLIENYLNLNKITASNVIKINKLNNCESFLNFIINSDLIITDDEFISEMADDIKNKIIHFKFENYNQDYFINKIQLKYLTSINLIDNIELLIKSEIKLIEKSITKINRKLDILIPTYNRPKLLFNLIYKSIVSVPEDIFLYIIDDGSYLREFIEGVGYLNTREVCEYFNSKNIIYRRNDINLGIAEAWRTYYSGANIAKYAMSLTDKDEIISFDSIQKAILKLDRDDSLLIVIMPIQQMDRTDVLSIKPIGHNKIDFINFINIYIEDENLQHCSMGGGGVYRTSNKISNFLDHNLGLKRFGLDDGFGIDFYLLMAIIYGGNIDFINTSSIKRFTNSGATEKFPLTFAYCYYQYVKYVFSYIYSNEKNINKAKRKYYKFWILLMIRGHYVSLNPVHGTESEYGTSRIRHHLNFSFYIYIIYQLLKNKIIPDLEMIRLLIGAYLHEHDSDILVFFNTLMHRLVYKNQ
jgi:hypothetical protein